MTDIIGTEYSMKCSDCGTVVKSFNIHKMKNRKRCDKCSLNRRDGRIFVRERKIMTLSRQLLEDVGKPISDYEWNNVKKMLYHDVSTETNESKSFVTHIINRNLKSLLGK
jgi:hypothetical protein